MWTTPIWFCVAARFNITDQKTYWIYKHSALQISDFAMLFKVLVACHGVWHHVQPNGTLVSYEGNPNLHLGGSIGLVFGDDQCRADDLSIGMAITVVDQRALCCEPRSGEGGNELVVSFNRSSVIVATIASDGDEMNVTETDAGRGLLVVARKLAALGARDGRLRVVRFLGRRRDGGGSFHGFVWI